MYGEVLQTFNKVYSQKRRNVCSSIQYFHNSNSLFYILNIHKMLSHITEIVTEILFVNMNIECYPYF